MWAFRFPPEGPLRNKHRRHLSYKSPRDVVTLGAPAASSLQAWVGWGCAASWRLLPAGISSNQISGPSLLSFFLRHIYELLPRHPTGVSKPNPSFPPNLACSSITRCHPDERQPRSYKRNLEIIPDPSPCCPSQPRQYSQFELLL